MEYIFSNCGGHIEVLDDSGRFLFSADTIDEAYREISNEHPDGSDE